MLTFFFHHALYFVSTSERLCETKAANKIAFLGKWPATAHFTPGLPKYEESGGWSHLYAFEVFSSWCSPSGYHTDKLPKNPDQTFKRYIWMRFPEVTSFLLIIACIVSYVYTFSDIFCLSFCLTV